MTLQRTFVLLGVGMAVAPLGCGRANLDAITRVPATGGGGGGATGGSGGSAIDGGDAAGTGGSGSGGSVIDAGDTSLGGDSGTGGTGSGGTVTCPTPRIQSGDTTQTVQVGSTSRTYVLHVPSAYDGSKAVPLILDFHAQASSGSAERSNSPYPAQTDREGVVMAFPDGLRGPMGAAWNFGPCCVAGVDDVAFAKALVAQVQTKACIDPNRVYAVGTATGGGLAHYLACRAADVFAAVAPAAFDLVEENVADCRPARAITVVSFRGTADPLVPYEGGLSEVVPGMPVTLLGAQVSFRKWSEIDQCTDSPSPEDSSNGCSSYSGCQGGVEVVLCTKQGGGLEHGNARVGWPILKRHTL